MGLSKQVSESLTVSSVKEDLEALFLYHETNNKNDRYVLLYTFVAQPKSIFINNKILYQPNITYVQAYLLLRIHRIFFRDL